MRALGKFRIIVPVIVMMLVMTACRIGEERYELTHYMNSSVATFKRRTGVDLEKQGNGVYLKENVLQVMAPEGKVTSVMLLGGAKEYTVLGVGIGMKKTEAIPLIRDAFGKEKSKVINSDSTVTYTYLNNADELYINFDVDKETVTQVSYYKLDAPKDTKATDGEETNSGELIAMIGDTRVYYNEAMVYLKSIQGSYETEYGNNIWNADILGNGNSFGNMIKDEVIKQITELKIIRAKAAELNVTLDDEEKTEAASYAKEHYEGLTAKDIKQYHITQDLLQRVYEDNLLANKVFETITINVDTNVSDAQAKQITVQDIYIRSVNVDLTGKKTPLSAEDKQKAYEKAQSLLTQAKGTQDFKALAEANSQADTVEFTFGKGEAPKDYGTAFEQAAFGLKTGQVSDLVATDDGWHILYCVSDFNEDATTQVKETIIDQRRTEMFSKKYAEWASEFEVVVNKEAWASVTYEN